MKIVMICVVSFIVFIFIQLDFETSFRNSRVRFLEQTSAGVIGLEPTTAWVRGRHKNHLATVSSYNLNQ